MILFLVLLFSNRIIFDFSFNISKIFFIFLFSVLLSLALITLRNNDRKITKKKWIKIHINPIIKSTLHDYIDSVLMAVIIIALSLFVEIELFKDKNILNEMAEPVFIPLILFTLLSIGFIGLSDSVKNTNWLFYSIVSLHFKYHLKRTLLFVASFYGIVILQYVIAVMYIDIRLLLIYLFAVISMMLFFIGTAFSNKNILKKIIVYVIYIRIALYILYFNPYIMLAGISPLFFVFFMAKNDFMEWGHL
jgi:hypothetical protein